ncbi:MAG TPA: AMP-binding protein [Candidatus Udaeobacter sp.]|nr:AMP-binding protein [Candidatus Udaeobacter sp.]
MADPPIPEPRQALAAMIAHAARHSPHYRDQGWAACVRNGQSLTFRDIPLTPAKTVKAEAARFYSAFVPSEDGAITSKYTSGSTGEPLEVRKTDRHFQINMAENQRLQAGWEVQRHSRHVHVMHPGAERPIGRIVEKDRKNGGRTWELSSLDTRAAFDLLSRVGATHIIAFPSIIQGVLELCAETGRPLPLELITTYSEVVSDELRRLARGLPNCRVMDTYGAIEAGLIVAQCASCGDYHPADRHLILELLGEDGRPVAAGEMGRVVVTPLFNRAMPFLRYEIGDYAVLGSRKDCPRSPRAITRIVGREKNLFKLPDGRKVAPTMPSNVALELGLGQYKLIQTTLHDIELHYVLREGAAELEPGVIQNVIDRYLSPGFKVRPVRVSGIPRAPSGKFLMHESLV